MSGFAGLELRKVACEALGYKFVVFQERVMPTINRLYVLRPDGSRYGGYNADFYSDGFNRLQFYPAIESDPAVSEPMFLEWLGSHRSFALKDYFKDVQQTDRMYEIEIAWSSRESIFVDGSTPSEARARAIVEASQ